MVLIAIWFMTIFIVCLVICPTEKDTKSHFPIYLGTSDPLTVVDNIHSGIKKSYVTHSHFMSLEESLNLSRYQTGDVAQIN